MRRSAPGHLSLLLVLLLPAAALAQDARAAEGYKLFSQSCSVCHLKPSLVSPRFGPALDHDTVAGKEEAIRGFIQTGTPRMPGFRYGLTDAQIDAIVAYLATVPPVPPADQGGSK
jgi:mono/diheme cytochrome c family protein